MVTLKVIKGGEGKLISTIDLDNEYLYTPNEVAEMKATIVNQAAEIERLKRQMHVSGTEMLDAGFELADELMALEHWARCVYRYLTGDIKVQRTVYRDRLIETAPPQVQRPTAAAGNQDAG